MKQLLTILLLFPLFIACSSDDDNHGDTLEEQIVGTWVTEPDNHIKLETLSFSKAKDCKGYTSDGDLIIDSKYTVYADAVKFSFFTATIKNDILIVDDVADLQWKFKRK